MTPTVLQAPHAKPRSPSLLCMAGPVMTPGPFVAQTSAVVRLNVMLAIYHCVMQRVGTAQGACIALCMPCAAGADSHQVVFDAWKKEG